MATLRSRKPRRKVASLAAQTPGRNISDSHRRPLPGSVPLPPRPNAKTAATSDQGPMRNKVSSSKIPTTPQRRSTRIAGKQSLEDRRLERRSGSPLPSFTMLGNDMDLDIEATDKGKETSHGSPEAMEPDKDSEKAQTKTLATSSTKSSGETPACSIMKIYKDGSLYSIFDHTTKKYLYHAERDADKIYVMGYIGSTCVSIGHSQEDPFSIYRSPKVGDN